MSSDKPSLASLLEALPDVIVCKDPDEFTDPFLCYVCSNFRQLLKSKKCGHRMCMTCAARWKKETSNLTGEADQSREFLCPLCKVPFGSITTRTGGRGNCYEEDISSLVNAILADPVAKARLVPVEDELPQSGTGAGGKNGKGKQKQGQGRGAGAAGNNGSAEDEDEDEEAKQNRFLQLYRDAQWSVTANQAFVSGHSLPRRHLPPPESMVAANRWVGKAAGRALAVESAKPALTGRKRLWKHPRPEAPSGFSVSSGLYSLVDQPPNAKSSDDAGARRLLEGASSSSSASSSGAVGGTSRLIGAGSGPGPRLAMTANSLRKARQEQPTTNGAAATAASAASSSSSDGAHRVRQGQRYYLLVEDFEAVVFLRPHPFDDTPSHAAAGAAAGAGAPIIIPREVADELFVYPHATFATIPMFAEAVALSFINKTLAGNIKDLVRDKFLRWRKRGGANTDKDEASAAPSVSSGRPPAKRARLEDEGSNDGSEKEKDEAGKATEAAAGSVSAIETESLPIELYHRYQLCRLLVRVRGKHLRLWASDAINPEVATQEILFKSGKARQQEEFSLSPEGGTPQPPPEALKSISAFRDWILDPTTRPQASDLPDFLRSFVFQRAPASRQLPFAIDATVADGPRAAAVMRPIDDDEEINFIAGFDDDDDEDEDEEEKGEEENDDEVEVVEVVEEEEEAAPTAAAEVIDSCSSSSSSASSPAAPPAVVAGVGAVGNGGVGTTGKADDSDGGNHSDGISDEGEGSSSGSAKGMDFIRFAADYWRYLDLPLTMYYSINWRHSELKAMAWAVDRESSKLSAKEKQKVLEEWLAGEDDHDDGEDDEV